MLIINQGVLNSYYPPDQYTGELDVPFETWTNLLQSTPCPTGNSPSSIDIAAANQYAFSYNNDADHFAPSGQLPAQGWADMWNPPPPTSQPSVQYQSHNSQNPPAWGDTRSNPAMGQQGNLQWNVNLQSQQPSQIYQQQYDAQPQVSTSQASSQWASSGALPLNIGVSGQQTSPERQRQQNEELNFGMGLYQSIPRRN